MQMMKEGSRHAPSSKMECIFSTCTCGMQQVRATCTSAQGLPVSWRPCLPGLELLQGYADLRGAWRVLWSPLQDELLQPLQLSASSMLPLQEELLQSKLAASSKLSLQDELLQPLQLSASSMLSLQEELLQS